MSKDEQEGPAESGAPRLVQWFGHRGAGVAWVLVGLLYIAFVAGTGGVLAIRALRAGYTARTILIGATTGVALALWLRIWFVNWRAIRPLPLQIRPEDTGIWGVGGPGIRDPGSTGISRRPRPAEDDEPGGG